MKFSLQREDLFSALIRVRGIANRRAIARGAGYLKMICSPNNLQILATDGDIYVVQDLPNTSIEKTGEVIVDIKILYDIVFRVSYGTTLFFEKQKKLKITYDRSIFRIGLHVDNVNRNIPNDDNMYEVSVKSSDLFKALNQISFISAKVDRFRPMFCGVDIEFKDNKLIAIAVDGFRIGRKFIKCKFLNDKRPDFNIVIPSDGVNYIENFLQRLDTSIKIIFSNSILILEFYNVKFCIRLMDYKHPECNNIFPKRAELPNTLDIEDTDELINIIESVSSVSLEKREPMAFSIDVTQTMIVSLFDFNTGDAQQKVSVFYEGDPILIGLNIHYITSILANISSKKATIFFKKDASNGIVLIKDKADDNLDYALMPMSLKYKG